MWLVQTMELGSFHWRILLFFSLPYQEISQQVQVSACVLIVMLLTHPAIPRCFSRMCTSTYSRNENPRASFQPKVLFKDLVSGWCHCFTCSASVWMDNSTILLHVYCISSMHLDDMTTESRPCSCLCTPSHISWLDNGFVVWSVFFRKMSQSKSWLSSKSNAYQFTWAYSKRWKRWTWGKRVHMAAYWLISNLEKANLLPSPVNQKLAQSNMAK